jgi:Icc-related predicted phosphoesterase
MTRLFFCTDVHGSEVCFRKFLSAGKVYEAGVVIMGGDCTGKMIIPLVSDGNGGYHCSWSGGDVDVHSAEELAELERQIQNNGLYPARMDAAERARLQADPDHLAELFSELMAQTLRRWLALAEERLKDSGLRVIFTPGNDDEWAVDDVLAESTFVEHPEGTIARIDDRHELLSLGWSNETPWDTPRECSEPELAEKIAALAAQVEDMPNAIFNIHVPPYGTGLDNAPELEDSGDKVKRGGSIMKPVGSTAVRDAILEHQPLLTLHGHIHESRGVQKLGRTVVINPGSAYSDWTLQGVIVDLEDGQVARYVPTTG